ncbi:MAG: hypothetical protein L0Y71_21760 [Gemmataceae bacterium]|nr:hypothetical protein [Gemmataceae bacterium]
MLRITFAAVAAAAFAVAQAPAQDKDKVAEKKPALVEKTLTKTSPAVKPAPAPGIPGEVEVSFLNGSNVRMILQSNKVDVATPYGQLSVPSHEIRAIEFGLHFPDGYDARIRQAIKSLGGDNFRERDQGGKTLLELGPYSYPAVFEASLTKELETSRRAKELLKQLQAKHPKKDLKTSPDDRVITPSFTIVGRILNTSIKANAELFGQVDLPVSRLRMMRSLAGGGDIEVSVDAARYGNQGQWLETEYTVDGINGISITANGMVDVWPQQGGNYVVGANGLQGRNMGMAFNAAMMRAGVKLRNPINKQIYGGALIGKIGEDGEMFLIGERYEGTPDQQGKLFLHIGESPWNNQQSGTYEVKIARKN